MTLVAGIDSSTQSVKVVIRNSQTGELVREGSAKHPEGTEVHPKFWWEALQTAIDKAGGIEDVAALSVGGQQHGMVVLDAEGEVIRPALLWNDVRSAKEAQDLVDELGGAEKCSARVGTVFVAAITASKLRWLADNEPENAAKVAAVALPHDWLSWKLQGGKDLSLLFTDRGDASGTGYFDPKSNKYCEDILAMALRRDASNLPVLPRVLAPNEFGGVASALNSKAKIAPGTGDNAAAALGIQAELGDVVISLGTSGTAFAVSKTPTSDPSGCVAGFADATGNFLPLVCTLNAARVLDATARILGVDHEELARLALAAQPGSGGLTLLPYFEGERTPNRPKATGVISGLNLANANREDFARAAFEGMLSGLVDGVDALKVLGVDVKRILLVGGASRSVAVPTIAASLLHKEVLLHPPGEFVADGAARQAAWALSGAASAPVWNLGEVTSYTAEKITVVGERYAKLRDATNGW